MIKTNLGNLSDGVVSLMHKSTMSVLSTMKSQYSMSSLNHAVPLDKNQSYVNDKQLKGTGTHRTKSMPSKQNRN